MEIIKSHQVRLSGFHLTFSIIPIPQWEGVQVLANDWDHVKQNQANGEKQPCSNFEDNGPTVAEEAVTLPWITPTRDCSYITKTNGRHLSAERSSRS